MMLGPRTSTRSNRATARSVAAVIAAMTENAEALGLQGVSTP